MTDLIDKAKQLGISHFTVHDFVDEIERLRKIEAAAKELYREEQSGYSHRFWNAFNVLVEMLK